MNEKNKFLSGVILGFIAILSVVFPAVVRAQDRPIPASEYYSGTWSNEHIRLSRLPSLDSLRLLLIDTLTPQFCMPVRQVKVISPYGKRGSRQHTGIDLKQTPRDTIFAVFDGRVRMAKVYSGYGNTVVLRHANGLETVYAHLSKLWVGVDSVLVAGTPLGLAGRSGRASTEHLHFECRFLYEPFNPATMIDFDDHCLRADEMLVCGGKVRSAPPHPAAALQAETHSAAELKAEAHPVAASEGEELSTVPPTKEKVTYHKIKAGDTLYSLAKRYGTTVDQLKAWNAISKPSALSIGRRIKVAQAN